VQDVIGKTGSFAKQFVVGGVTQFVEGWQVSWAVSIIIIVRNATRCISDSLYSIFVE